MNRWLKALGCFLVLLFGQSQAGLAVEEINKAVRVAALDSPDGPPPCGQDNICNLAACPNDPDCPDSPNGSSGNTNPPATTLGLTGTPSPTGLSGFSGSKFTRGTATSTNTAVFAILSRERSDNPCYVAIGTENVNNAALDTTPTPEIDLCGSKGPTSSTLHADYLDTNAGGGDNRVFVSGV